MQVQLNDEVAHVAFGEALGQALKGHGRVYLEGDSGAANDLNARHFAAYGYQGAVKSPTTPW